jgi:hypothetical protein
VRWDAAAGRSPGVNVGQAALAAPTLNVTCPLSLADARRGIRAQYVAPGAGALTTATASGALATVRIANVSAINFLTSVIQPIEIGAPLPSDLAAVSGSSSAAAAESAVPGGVAGEAGASSPSPSSAPLASRVAFSYLLQTDCGAP